MEKAMADTAARTETTSAGEGGFNYNKLQAVLCMVSSAAVSIGLIVWAVRAFL